MRVLSLFNHSPLDGHLGSQFAVIVMNTVLEYFVHILAVSSLICNWLNLTSRMTVWCCDACNDELTGPRPTSTGSRPSRFCEYVHCSGVRV